MIAAAEELADVDRQYDIVKCVAKIDAAVQKLRQARLAAKKADAAWDGYREVLHKASKH